MRNVLATLVAVGCWLVSAQSAFGQLLDEIPLADTLEVLVLDRKLVAIDARHGGQREESLRLHEAVVWTGSRGDVGVVLTDERVLAVAGRSAAWQFEDFGREESAPERAVLGDRVALIVTSHRALGFNGGSGNLVESRLGIRENVIAQRAGENVAVVVTDRRALGLSPLVGGFFEAKILAAEKIESVTANANLATVTTNRRVLIFRATTGTWEERRRSLN
jgi:hypothetical protein